MHRTLQVLRILVGFFFLCSAGAKAVSSALFAVQISYYGIIEYPFLLNAIAIAVIGFEALLGLALIFMKREQTWLLPLTFLVLSGFSGLIAYAWSCKGLAECGCFGEYVSMTPVVSIAKNVGLMAVVAWIWAGERRRYAGLERASLRKWIFLVMAAGLIAGLGIARMGEGAEAKGAMDHQCRNDMVKRMLRGE